MPVKECEEELRDKGRLIDRLQLKTTQIATLLQNLEAAKTFDLPSPLTAGSPGVASGFPFHGYGMNARPQNFDAPIGHNSSLHQMRPSKKSPFTPTPTGHGQFFTSPGCGNPGKSRIKPIPSFEEIQKLKQQRLQEETKSDNTED